MKSQKESELAQPWRRGTNLWHTLLGMILFERAKPIIARDFWPTYVRRWPTPREYLCDRRAEAATWAIGRSGDGKLLERVALEMDKVGGSSGYADMEISGLSRERIALAATLCDSVHSLQPTPQTTRIANRVFEEYRRSFRVDHQLALVRFIGELHSGQAYGALLEVGAHFCLPSEPQCEYCPLRRVCTDLLPKS